MKMNMNERELGRLAVTETLGGRGHSNDPPGLSRWRSCLISGGWSEACAKEGTRFGGAAPEADAVRVEMAWCPGT